MYELRTLTHYHTQKVGTANPAKQNQLNNFSLNDPSQVFKDGTTALSPSPHPFVSRILFPKPLQQF